MKETLVEQRVRVGLHCIVGGLMYLLCCIIDVPKLHSHVETVSNDIHGYKTIGKDLLVPIRTYRGGGSSFTLVRQTLPHSMNNFKYVGSNSYRA